MLLLTVRTHRDIPPKTNGGKLFSCFFVCLGHAIIGVCVGYIGHQLCIQQNVALQKKNENGIHYNVDAAQDNIDTANLNDSSRSAIARVLQTDAANSNESSRSERILRTVERTLRNLSAMNIVQSRLALVRTFSWDDTRIPWQSASFIPMVKSMIAFLLPVAAVIFIGVIVMKHLENWSWIDALYWCTMTGTTVG